jgi:hypothetical protein
MPKAAEARILAEVEAIYRQERGRGRPPYRVVWRRLRGRVAINCQIVPPLPHFRINGPATANSWAVSIPPPPQGTAPRHLALTELDLTGPAGCAWRGPRLSVRPRLGPPRWPAPSRHHAAGRRGRARPAARPRQWPRYVASLGIELRQSRGQFPILIAQPCEKTGLRHATRHTDRIVASRCTPVVAPCGAGKGRAAPANADLERQYIVDAAGLLTRH